MNLPTFTSDKISLLYKYGNKIPMKPVKLFKLNKGKKQKVFYTHI